MSKALLCLLATATLTAQTAPPPESLRPWKYYKEVRPPTAQSEVLSFTLDVQTLDQARPDGGDLRLYRASGTEIPYLMHVRRGMVRSRPLDAREFNRGVTANSAQLSLDLGPDVAEHNEVIIRSEGMNFRRKVDVDGSADANNWSTLASKQLIFRFGANGPEVQQQAVSYPVSRYRYLRIHVMSDAEVDRGAPEITGVTVLRSFDAKSELLTFFGQVSGRVPDRQSGRAASVWRIDLRGRIPFESVLLSVNEPTFSRPYQLEDVDDPSAPVLLSSGELTHHENAVDPRTGIALTEHRARILKLTVTDDRNPPLTIVSAAAVSAAREVVFRPVATGVGTLRLYYGNANAVTPHYDMRARSEKSAPVRMPLGPQENNPIYAHDPKALSERSPWLVYVVLLAASIALGWILFGLLKQAAPPRA